MKAVMISIRPEWVAKIASGEKTIEVRKSKPTTLPTPFKCYIYCTDGKPLYIAESPYCKEHKRVLRLSEDGKSIPFRNGTQINKTVIGEFVCDYIRAAFEPADGLVDVVDCEQSCLTPKEIIRYADGKMLYFWHISNLVIYDHPMEITDFSCVGICPYNPKQGILCTYGGHCYRAGIYDDGHGHGRCGAWMDRPPQSWCYVEELRDG